MKEIPFSPEMMQTFINGCSGMDGKPNEGNSNTATIEAMKKALSEALRDLTPRQLEVVQLYYWEGMTQEEIGRELGVARQVVARHLQKSLDKLRRCKQFVKYD